MVDIRGWTPADKAGVGTFCVAVIVLVGGFVAYVRSDYTQVNQQVAEAAKQEVARLTSQIGDLRMEMRQRDDNTQSAMKQRDDNIQAVMKQRDDNIQAQIRDITIKLDQRPGPETMSEIKRRQAEDEGTIRLILNQLSAIQTTEATHEVRLQSLEKGKDVSLPGHR